MVVACVSPATQQSSAGKGKGWAIHAATLSQGALDSGRLLVGEQLIFIKGMGPGRWNDPVMTPTPISIYELDSGFFKKN